MCANSPVEQPLPSEISLFSPARSPEHIELCTRLQHSLSTSCQMVFDIDRCDPASVMLFDCREISAIRIEHWLFKSKQYRAPACCVLINVVDSSLHELLMDWPQVVGIFHSNSSYNELVQGIEEILQGRLALPDRLYQQFLLRLRRPPSAPRIRASPVNLTRREFQVLEGIYSGFSNARIADWLALSEHTIKTHLSNAYRKLGIRNRLEACTWMREHYGFLENTMIS